MQFGLFSDGVFVTGASDEHRNLVGRQVIRIGNVEVEELVRRTQAVTFFENQSRARMMAPDRLALVEVLADLGAIDAPGPVTITFESDAVTLEPLSGDIDNWFGGQPDVRPRWTRDIKTDEWFEVVPQDDAIYVQVNRFAENPQRPYSEFVAQTLAAAARGWRVALCRGPAAQLGWHRLVGLFPLPGGSPVVNSINMAVYSFSWAAPRFLRSSTFLHAN